MAGKHYNGEQGDIDGELYKQHALTRPPVYPGTRVDRAYAEGREAFRNGLGLGDNPFGFNIDWPEQNAWGNGFIAARNLTGEYAPSQWQTAEIGVPNP